MAKINERNLPTKAPFTFDLSTEMRASIAKTARKLDVNITAFIRIAINEKLKRHEEEKRQDNVHHRVEDRGLNRGLSGISRIAPDTANEFDPKPLAISFAEKIDTSRQQESSPADEKLYAELAKHIVAAGEDPVEIRRRAAKAVDSMRRARVLTCPPEHEILIKLEEHIAKIRLDVLTPKNDPYAKLVGVMLDVKKIRSLGNVDEPADEVPTETE